jgi:hypothetical protein
MEETTRKKTTTNFYTTWCFRNVYNETYYIIYGNDQVLYVGMAVLREKMFTFAKLLRTPCLSFPESMLKKIHSSPAKLRKIIHHGSLLDSFVSTQLASGNPFSGQIVAD